MLIQLATRSGWSEPQDVIDSIAVQMLNGGRARPAVIVKAETTMLSRALETAARIFRLKT